MARELKHALQEIRRALFSKHASTEKIALGLGRVLELQAVYNNSQYPWNWRTGFDFFDATVVLDCSACFKLARKKRCPQLASPITN